MTPIADPSGQLLAMPNCCSTIEPSMVPDRPPTMAGVT